MTPKRNATVLAWPSLAHLCHARLAMSDVSIRNDARSFTRLQSSVCDRVIASLSAYPERRKKVVSILRGECRVSLRMMDWMVTSHSRTISLRIRSPDGHQVYVHDEYRSILNAYRRRHFDPFRRTIKTESGLPDTSLCRLHVQSAGTEEVFDTSIGQLNFLEWATRCGVVEYVEANREALESAMNKATAAIRDKRADRPTQMSKCYAYEI